MMYPFVMNVADFWVTIHSERRFIANACMRDAQYTFSFWGLFCFWA